ncbi:hypothetical protein [[Kitasatospora] papulosa]|uniref:hypothetical protein n=1 Tax=[Kitasatospora] papulosa TaxID=1464011 RepID=UPI0036CD33D3
MRKSFALNTEPHVADVGGTELKFEPEVMGDEFLDAYAEMREGQEAKGVDLDNLGDANPADVRRVVRSLRVFLARQMLPESAADFLRVNVIDATGTVLATFDDQGGPDGLAEAEAFAAEEPGRRIVDVLRFPTRVVVELLEWVVELYGGGDRPTTSSSASATTSRPSGKRGTAASPSKASTRTPGR